MELIVIATDIIEKLILFVLLGLSVWSISIIIDRYRALNWQIKNDPYSNLKNNIKGHTIKNHLNSNSNSNSNSISKNENPDSQNQLSFLNGAIQALIESHQSPDTIRAALSSYIKEEKMKLEKGLAVLATLGSNAPFIGLFGTVLGIIRSFAYLGSQSGTASVMSGISQALFATAIGLFVAIPAVIGFNVFTKTIKDLITKAEALRDLYLSEMRDPSGKL